MSYQFDDAVVGAGIIGLAHAYHLARQGRRVVVFEKNRRAIGASSRNFGMLWPVGQPDGVRRKTALRSLEIWRVLLRRPRFGMKKSVRSISPIAKTKLKSFVNFMNNQSNKTLIVRSFHARTSLNALLSFASTA